MAYDQCVRTGRRDSTNNHERSGDSNTTTKGGPPTDLYSGVLTTTSRKRLTRAINLLCAIARPKEATDFKTGKLFKFRVNFITLTLPAPQGDIPDKDIKKCLDNWIKRAKRKYHLNSYVWRAEVQQNQNIHFHMLSDTYIRWDLLRNDWNECLAPTGLVKKFEAKHGHSNPNSTDVHAVLKIRNLSAYFVKYMSKSHKEGDRKILGKVWDCSKNLKTKLNVNYEASTAKTITFNSLQRDESLRSIKTDRYAITFIPHEQFHKYLSADMVNDWNAYLAKIRADGC